MNYKCHNKYNELSEDDNESLSEDDEDEDKDGMCDLTHEMRREIEEGEKIHFFQEKIKMLEISKEELNEAKLMILKKEDEIRTLHVELKNRSEYLGNKFQSEKTCKRSLKSMSIN